MNAPFSPSLALTLIFSLTLLLGLLLKFWLATRQIRHVAGHRDEVPTAFAHTITLAAHQKAADYTVAKSRFGLLELSVGTAVLIGWTLLGGLHVLNQALAQWLGNGMAQQLALLAAFVLIGGAIELPLSLYQTFVIEERFGFNKMTLKLWLMDLLKSSLIGALIGLPIAALILWVMGAAGEVWWLWAWCIWMGFNLLLLLIYPTFKIGRAHV
jgi:STE24 endopeptidase